VVRPERPRRPCHRARERRQSCPRRGRNRSAQPRGQRQCRPPRSHRGPGCRARCEEGTWTIAKKVAKDRVISTVDAETRHGHKSTAVRTDGFKAHLATEPDTGIVTALKLTPANHPDGPVGVALMADEPDGLEVLADSAYGSGAVRTALREKHHRLVIKPLPSRPTSPAGSSATTSRSTTTPAVSPALSDMSPGSLQVASRPSPRAVFPVRCGLVARKQEHGASPFLSTTPSSSQRERTGTTPNCALPIDNTPDGRALDRLARREGNRRLRYRGVERNEAWLNRRVAALNLRRLVVLGLTRSDGTWVLAGT